MGKTSQTARQALAAIVKSRRDRHPVTGPRLMPREVRALEPHIFNGMKLSTFRGTLREMREKFGNYRGVFHKSF